MKLLGMILEGEEHLEDVLAVFAEVGVVDAVVVDAEGLERVLSHMPIFAPLSAMVRGARQRRRLVLGVTDNDAALKEAETLLKDYGLNLRESGGGVLFIIPVEGAVFLAE